MWIEQTKEGYRFIEKYKDPLTETWKRTSVVRPTKSNMDRNAAVRLLAARIAKLTQEVRYYPYTLEEAVEAYVAWQYENHKKQSARNAAEECERMMLKVGKNVIISKLTAPYIRENLKSKPETYNVLLKRFKALMRWCYEADMIEDIKWIDKLHPMKTASTKEKNATKYLEHDEINAVLEAMTYDRWRLMTEFLILSGLRVGEAIALLDEDITDVINVDKTYARKIKEVSSAKTENSNRQIPIQAQLEDCVKRIRKFRKREMMLNGWRSDIFLPNHDGGYCSYSAYVIYFHDITRKVLNRTEKIHALRHTHVAMLAEAGLSLDEIARRVGHSNSQITRDVYYHVTSKQAEKDRERIQNVKII